MCRAALLLLAVAGCAAEAGAGDPLKSDACGRQLAALQAARAGPARVGEVEAARRQAAEACLGGGGEVRRPSPVAQPPLVVPPPTIEPPPVPPPVLAAPVPLPPPVRVERPAVITACDAGGCWDSSGTRLNRNGDVLIGPRGACVGSGVAVTCP
jgi:hypothetical protein